MSAAVFGAYLIVAVGVAISFIALYTFIGCLSTNKAMTIIYTFIVFVHWRLLPATYGTDYACLNGFSHIPQNMFVNNIPEEFLSFSREIYESYEHLTGD